MFSNTKFIVFQKDRIKKSFIPLLLMAFVLSFNMANGQKELHLEKFTVVDGLNSNMATDIFQDSRGYLWIGTPNGVNYYNGYEFKKLKIESDIQSSSGGIQVFQIYEDSLAQIWITTDQGVFSYNPESAEIKQYFIDPTVGSRNIFPSIMQTKGRHFLLGGVSHPLYDLNANTGQFQAVAMPAMDPIQPAWNYVAIMERMPDGNILMANWQYGLLIYHAKSKKIESITPLDENREALNLLQTWAIKYDPRGWYWLGDTKGVYKYDLKTNLAKKIIALDFSPRGNGPITFFNDISIDQNGDVWIPIFSNGLYLIKDGRAKPYRFKRNANDPKGLENNLFQASLVDEFNILWLGSSASGLKKFDIEREYFSTLRNDPKNQNSLSGNFIFSIYEDPKNSDLLWIGTNDFGLNRFDRKRNRYRRYSHNENNPFSISSNSIRAIYRQKNGDLWLGNWGQGLDIMDSRMRKKKNIKFSEQPGSIENSVRVINGDDHGNIWIGTIGSLYQYHLATGKIEEVPGAQTMPIADDSLIWLKNQLDLIDNSFLLTEIKDDVDTSLVFSADSGSYFIVSLGEGQMNETMFDYGWLEDARGNELWSMQNPQYTLHDGGAIKNRIRLGVVDLDSGQYKLRYKSDDSHSFGKYNAAPPPDSSWWGISLYPISSDLADFIKRFTDEEVLASRFQGKNITSIQLTDSNTVYISTQTHGLNKYDYRSGKFSNFQHDPFSPQLSKVKHFAIAPDGIIWEATDGGLVRFDEKNSDVRVFTAEDGLPTDLVESVLIDHSGDVWAATQSGLCRFIYDDSSGSVQTVLYDSRDGLFGSDYTFNAAYINRSGELFFGSRNGLDHFYPPHRNKNAPQVILSSLRINGKDFHTIEKSEGKANLSSIMAMTLPYNENNLEMEFLALHFVRPEKNKYKFRMLGFNNEWANGKRRYASFTNLEPGQYEFQVEAANSDGVWSQKGRSLKIKILPPWWKTITAYFGYGLFLILAVFSLDRIQRKRIQHREREAAAIREAELRAHAAELQAKASEAQNRALQAESERKTKELEDARKLQLSMLPKELPKIPGLDIAAAMQTATEVGGDYYDFILSDNNDLTVAFGDAAGHGTKAGIMVAMLKTLFSSETGHFDISAFAKKCNATFRNTNMEKILVGLTLLKIEKDKIHATVAGMPPLFIYRHASKKVEEILMDAPPMGAFKDFDYQQTELKFLEGDAIVLISDGLPEQKNGDGEELGYPMIEKCIAEHGIKNSANMIIALEDLGQAWSRKTEIEDDITLLVIKKVK